MRVGVFGASGYAGREAVRILGRHPEASVAFATGSGEGRLPHEDGLARDADAYLLALPHGISSEYASKLRTSRPDAVVIDLSGDLRIPTAEGYRHWYGHPHPAPALLGAPYGLSEIFADDIRKARLVANPGCYATSVLLPLLPLLVDGRVDASDVVVDAKSGTTGAGRAPREDLLFSEVADDFSAYAPGRSHRHVGEMEAVIERLTGKSIAMTFCPHLLPVKRGILSALYLKSSVGAGALVRAAGRLFAASGYHGTSMRDLGEALGYMQRQWGALVRFLEDGRLLPDNNNAERQLRTVALGRKNWLFAGSLAGAKRAAILYSLTQSCRLAGIDCWAYFHDVLLQVATLPHQRIDELTPDRWAEARAQELGIVRP